MYSLIVLYMYILYLDQNYPKFLPSPPFLPALFLNNSLDTVSAPYRLMGVGLSTRGPSQ